MLLNDGSEWEPTELDIELWRDTYQAVDVRQELKAMASWLDANPTRRKTKRGIKRFVNTWLAKAQDRGGSPMVKGDTLIRKTRDMTALDDLTHNFTGDPAIRAYFIEKYGQCFEDGVRHER